MAQQTVTQPKKTPKHLYRKSIETTNNHTCAESDHRMLPIVKCENSREQHVPDSIACTQNQTSRVWVGCGAAHALCVQPTVPSPHAVKRKNAFADTKCPSRTMASSAGLRGCALRRSGADIWRTRASADAPIAAPWIPDDTFTDDRPTN